MIGEIKTIEDIQYLSEAVDFECKQAKGADGQGELPGDFWKTYSAMANTKGGVIALGIKENTRGFELVGIPNINRIKKQLFDILNNPNKVSVNLLTDKDVQVKTLEARTFLLIQIPMAKRQKQPVYINNNPMGNTYIRRHEGDYCLDNEAVKRMLAEQTEDTRDRNVLKGFDLDDLDASSIKIYRQVFANREPDHPFNSDDLSEFLKNIGAWRKDRDTGIEGVTIAGLLMFGKQTSIQDKFPDYMLDYQEHGTDTSHERWIDRVTLDGTWSGNIYDFYRRIYPKLITDIRVPFTIVGDQRIDDSSVNIAIREALCNALVHADYFDRSAIRIIKQKDRFEFRNPGVMRIPVSEALIGGHHDCRNKTLHQMFRFVGIGDQAGTGIPKILSSWKQKYWRQPELVDDRTPYPHTTLRLHMIDMFPKEYSERLKKQFGIKYDKITLVAKHALLLALSKKTLTHQELLDAHQMHPRDASDCLKKLVRENFLEQTGTGRGAVYHLIGNIIPGPEDVFGTDTSKFSAMDNDTNSMDNRASSMDNRASSMDNGASSMDNRASSMDNGASSMDNGASSMDCEPGTDTGNSEKDTHGRLLDSRYELPFIEDLDQVTQTFKETLKKIAQAPQDKKRVSSDQMQEIIEKLVDGHYMTLSCLSQLVCRTPSALRTQYLKPMIQNHQIKIAFPKTPNDPRQAYTRGNS